MWSSTIRSTLRLECAGYDHPLAEASLEAREQVAKRLRRELPRRVELNREKRHMTSGEINWSGMTYKLVYYPIYVGVYYYRNKLYRVLINGQTGKVGGGKPTDRVKVWAFGCSSCSAWLCWG